MVDKFQTELVGVGSSSESALHVFVECPFARVVCSSANIELGPLCSSFSCFLEWLSCCVVVLKHDQFDLLLALLHSIWRARNSLLWDDKQENPIVVTFTYGGGFICKIPHVIDPYTVEILAARGSLHQAAQWHWRLVILESNALQVVQALHSPHCGVSTIGLLIEDVKARLQSFATVKVNHICRFANVVPHSMAKLALSSTVPSLWFEVPPVIIQDAMLHDCMLH
ncbi:hypothetical protein D8674_018975 [Pyrus ussuriensis x Pyrus communis]|uniref:RNase H type-1 domain-containing protein n=1 Tax=Pyrus ussuriensis x Pyrus communis TaxID=2448454 RepID=A0A5N5G6G9_9ROSA|nr:hypothetical protein D8674_018975 [Pyrus ussuriensis x Pyrus communis]